jgi:hypothetical protein
MSAAISSPPLEHSVSVDVVVLDEGVSAVVPRDAGAVR